MCSNKYFGWSSFINLWKNQCMSEYKHAQKIVAIRETCILFIFFIVFSFCQITLSCPIFYPPNHINYEIELFSNMDTLFYNSSFLYLFNNVSFVLFYYLMRCWKIILTVWIWLKDLWFLSKWTHQTLKIVFEEPI